MSVKVRFMSRTSFLQYLIQEVFAPDIEKGAFTFLPETTTLHEVQERYEPQLGTALQMEEEDWEFIVQELEHWYERKLQEDPSHRSYLQREVLWDEMLAQCEELPSYDQVAEKLPNQKRKTQRKRKVRVALKEQKLSLW